MENTPMPVAETPAPIAMAILRTRLITYLDSNINAAKALKVQSYFVPMEVKLTPVPIIHSLEWVLPPRQLAIFYKDPVVLRPYIAAGLLFARIQINR